MWLWVKYFASLVVSSGNWILKSTVICGVDSCKSNHIPLNEPQLNDLVLFYPTHTHIFMYIYNIVSCLCETLTLCPVATIPKIDFLLRADSSEAISISSAPTFLSDVGAQNLCIPEEYQLTDKHLTKLSTLVVCCFQIYNSFNTERFEIWNVAT